MAEALRPCPLCGGTALDVYAASVGGTSAAVLCLTCRVTGPEGVTRNEAIRVWHLRFGEDTMPPLASP